MRVMSHMQDFEQRAETWRNFARAVAAATLFVAVVLAGMAVTLL